jgi:hypothetical protein
MSAGRNACRHPHVPRDPHLEAARGDVRLPAQDQTRTVPSARLRFGRQASMRVPHRTIAPKQRRECRPKHDPPVPRYRVEANAALSLTGEAGL